MSDYYNDNYLFCDKILSNCGFQEFDPINMMKSQQYNNRIGINLHSFVLYRYLYILARINKDFERLLECYEAELSSIFNNGYVSSIHNIGNGQFFKCLCLIDDLNQYNKIEVFSLIIQNMKAISQLDSELIVYIISTFAALSFKDEFSKSVDWLEGNYPSVLLNIFLKFQKVSQAIQFSLSLKNCSRQVMKQDSILQELIEKVIKNRQEETLFRQELNPLLDQDIVMAFQQRIQNGDISIIIVFIKYLIYRNQYLTALDVFENNQKTIKDNFQQEEVDLIISLFSAILKQYSSIQINELTQRYSFLIKYNVNRSGYSEPMQQEGFKSSNMETSAMKLFNIQQKNYSVKKSKYNNFGEDDYLVLMHFDKKEIDQKPNKDQMSIEHPTIMTPQSKERLESNQNTKSKRKWTTSKKYPSPI